MASMSISNRRKVYLSFALIQILLLLYAFGKETPALWAQSDQGHSKLIRFIDANELNIENPAGVIYVNSADIFLILDAQTNSGKSTAQSTVTAVTAYRDFIGSVTLPAQVDLHSIAYDSKNNHLYFFESATNQLLQFEVQSNGLPASSPSKRIQLAGLNNEINGLVLGADGKSIYILEAESLRISKIALDDNATVQTPSPLIDLQQLGLQVTVGLALNPQTGHLFVLDPTTQTLYELSIAGKVVKHYDLAEFNLKDPQGFVFAPSGDRTDHSDILSLYITDQKPAAQTQTPEQSAASTAKIYLPLVKGVTSTPAQVQNTIGRIAEVSFELPIESMIKAASVTDVGVIVQTVKTSDFSPPSPDPSGIAYFSPSPYLLSTNTLLITDGEIDEMPNYYAGVNMWEITLNGVLQKTYTTKTAVKNEITEEPAGAAFNPNNGHLFLCDDDNIRPVIEIDPGPDKIYRTSDDIVTKYGTRQYYGMDDPEGVEYARIGNSDWLFLVDGLNNEVHTVQPGPNGKFDGTDDIMLHFDSLALGIEDPEGIAYHPTTGTLYIAGKPNTRVAEITTTGTLVRYIDVSAAKANKLSGLAFAPGSQNPNQWNLYIVDRNVDNDTNPNENDGRMYEVALPTGGNQVPTVNAGVDITITLPASANLDATATDDGQPIPPGGLTFTWSKISGPGTVIFGNSAAVDTTASFSLPGNYILQLTANDGQLSASDSVAVKVNAVNQPPVVEAGADQSITLPSSATLTATVTDDGLPNPPHTVTTTWSKTSGPGTVTFENLHTLATTASFSAAGVYILNLAATDGELSASDALTITVNLPNTAPVVEAGSNQMVARNETALLAGTVTDDGLPNPPGKVSVAWSKVSGPGTVTFSQSQNITTTATFSAMGSYVLRLTANDSQVSASDELTITVTPPNNTPNQPPVVDAGPSQTIALSDTATLLGSVIDDGLPNPPSSVTVQWTVKSGPGTVTFGDPLQVNTTAEFTTAGVYVLELTATDGNLQASDTVTLIVEDAETPILIVGQGQAVQLTETIVLTATPAGAWTPSTPGLSATWSKLTGPGNVTLSTPNNLTTTASFDAAGDYTLKITVTDGKTVLDATVVVRVNAINQAPSVNAGSDLTTSVSEILQLTGLVSDDGLPNGSGTLTTQWSLVSGPGTVLFGNSNSINTTATFSVSGSYILKLTATDGELTSTDTLTVEVSDVRFQLFLPLIQ